MLLGKRYGSMACLLLLLVFMSVLQVQGAGKAALSPTQVRMEEGKSTTLRLKNSPGTVKWTTSDKKIAKIRKLGNDKIKITGVKKGTAVITASVEKNTYKCKVKVTRPKKVTYRYLALGNSLTIHSVCSFWWQNCGMAASTTEKDYVHQVMAGVRKKNVTIENTIFNTGEWELTTGQNRKNQQKKLKPLMKTKWDLITVQIGENIRSTYGFQNDFTELLKFLKKKNPEAKVVVVGNFWKDNTAHWQADKIKRKVCKKQKVAYADISPIVVNAAYRRGMGGIVYDYAGNPHSVMHPGAAAHPNDRGMAYIAEQILKAAKKSK